jgi:hypothetical protein
MTLEDLKTEFLKLSHAEALTLIMDIRASRRISKRPIVEKTKAAKKVKNTEINMDTLSPEMAMMLYTKLKGVAKK